MLQPIVLPKNLVVLLLVVVLLAKVHRKMVVEPLRVRVGNPVRYKFVVVVVVGIDLDIVEVDRLKVERRKMKGKKVRRKNEIMIFRCWISEWVLKFWRNDKQANSQNNQNNDWKKKYNNNWNNWITII